MEEAVKNDQDKIRVELLPVEALLDIAEVFTLGAKKYADWNYLNGEGLKVSRVYASAIRHLFKWFMGEDNDSEWGKSHLAHAGCCVMMLIMIYKYRKDADNRLKFAQ